MNSSTRIEILSAKINLTFHKAPIDGLITYVCLALEISVDSCFLSDRISFKEVSPLDWQLSKGHIIFFSSIGLLLSKFCTYMICGNKMPTRCNRGFFIADLIACSTCFGHHYAHHQELKSIIQWLLPVVFRAVVFQVAGLVWS